MTTVADTAWSVEAADRWLIGRAPLGMHFGLQRMRRLLAEVGDPQRELRAIHVVGTNGKSSTVRMTAAILRAHGLRTGAYLSPHLHSFAERIEVDGRAAAPALFAAGVEAVAAAAARVDASRAPQDQVTQFEALTAAAFLVLARRAVEVAVIEAGLGGRLDATNVIDSEVQALTSIGLEHTALLGSTHAAIAAEKLDVVRDHGTLVLGPGLPADVQQLAATVAGERRARVVQPARPSVAPSAPGPFQRRNFAVAEACAHALLGHLDPAAVGWAAATVRIPGRLDELDRAPLTVVDAAHNAAGVAALLEALPELRARARVAADAPLVAVLSVLSDKDVDAMLHAVAPACTAIVATGNSSPRVRDPRDLAARAHAAGARRVVVEAEPRPAVRTGRALAGTGGIVLVTGSICLAGDVLAEPLGQASPAYQTPNARLNSANAGISTPR